MDDYFNPRQAEFANNPMPQVEEAINATRPNWWQLAQFLPAVAQAEGAAGAHEASLRGEAADKMMQNFERVLRDICNPSPTLNIYGKPLTQAELKRVHPDMANGAAAMYVSQCMREVRHRPQPAHTHPPTPLVRQRP